MKYLLFILTTFFTSCNAQIISLEQAAQCQINPNCPDFNYVKDVNNSLNKYTGIWKGNYNGKTYELKFIKKIYFGDDDIKDDLLIGRIRITDNNQILYNSFNETDDNKTKFRGFYFTSSLESYMVHFSDSSPEGCINYGFTYLTIDPSDSSKMIVIYLPDYDITNGDCPNTFVPTLPVKQKIYLTKQ